MDNEHKPDKAFAKVHAMVALVQACQTRVEVHEALSILPHLADYVRLPDGEALSPERVQELRGNAKAH